MPVKKENDMTLGEKILTTKNRLYRDICNVMTSTGMDVALGLVILDAIKADIMSLGYEAALETLAQAEEKEEQNASECHKEGQEA